MAVIVLAAAGRERNGAEAAGEIVPGAGHVPPGVEALAGDAVICGN